LIGAVAREARFIASISRLLHRVGKVKPHSPNTVADIIEHWAAKRPDNVAIWFEDKRYTYRDYDAHANRYARWAQSQGLKKGDVVALLMENRPEYLFAWTGLVKVGATAALINTNLRERALAHSLASPRTESWRSDWQGRVPRCRAQSRGTAGIRRAGRRYRPKAPFPFRR
jgi:fatty-acyl-CoA synthase